MPAWLDPRCRCSAGEVPADVVGGYWHEWGCPVRTFNLGRAVATMVAVSLGQLTGRIIMTRSLPGLGSGVAFLLLTVPFTIAMAVSWSRRHRFPPRISTF